MQKENSPTTYPLVSVIMASYNREKEVQRCIDSILVQTYPNIEIIVVDDCSTDNTRKVLESYKDKITRIYNEVNSGISVNSNIGFAACKGELICLTGDDDYWPDESKVSKQVELIRTRNIDMCSTWWFEFDEFTGQKKFKRPRLPKSKSKLIERVLAGGGIVCGSAVMVTRKAWERVGGFDVNKKRGTDSDFFRRVILSGGQLELIPNLSVGVDVSSNRERMTKKNSIKSYTVHIESLQQSLSKHSSEYRKYPVAKAIYLHKIAFLYEQAGAFDKNLYKQALSYYAKSLIIRPMYLVNYFRFIRALIKRAVNYG